MSRFARTRVGGLLALLVLSGAGGSQAWSQDGRSAVVVRDNRVSESSALAVSPRDPELLHTVNDSGHDPVVYTVDRTSGDVVGTTLLGGLDPDTLDPEAIAVDPDGRLWVADTGDNVHRRTDVALYAVRAPGRGATRASPRRYPVHYASGHPDVEAMLVDPRSGTRWLVTKGLLAGQVLRLPGPMQPDQPVVPVPVDSVRVPGMVTDATVLPGRAGAPSTAVLRTYVAAHVYRLPHWSPVGTFALPRQEQGESVAALPDGRTLLAGSEGSPALIDEVAVPARIVRALDPGPSPAPAAPTDPGQSGPRGRGGADPTPSETVLWVTAGVGGLVLLGGAVRLVRRKVSR